MALSDDLTSSFHAGELVKELSSLIRGGGGIPAVIDLKENLGIDSVLTGFSLPDANLHGPNEKLHIPTWKRGVDALIHFFYNLADLQDQ